MIGIYRSSLSVVWRDHLIIRPNPEEFRRSLLATFVLVEERQFLDRDTTTVGMACIVEWQVLLVDDHGLSIWTN